MDSLFEKQPASGHEATLCASRESEGRSAAWNGDMSDPMMDIEWDLVGYLYLSLEKLRCNT